MTNPELAPRVEQAEEQTVFEINHRQFDGISVKLYWDQQTNETFVTVDDQKKNDYFTVQVPEGKSANDVFIHPYVYREA